LNGSVSNTDDGKADSIGVPEMTDEKPISAQPTKEFFVEMMIRDIPLEQAVLDLVDNCVDAAKAQKNEPQARLDDFAITITVSAQTFRIIDNCGGFGIAMARDYAFRFGRPPGRQPTPHSIGQFGVGMKSSQRLMPKNGL
jgi:hypothetical protein